MLISHEPSGLHKDVENCGLFQQMLGVMKKDSASFS